MTEQEAIENIKNFPAWNLDDQWLDETKMEELSEMVISALVEIQQYRELGTLENLKAMKESTLSGLELANIWATLEHLKKYEAVGTLEELREAREKQIPKKPQKVLLHHGVGYECEGCGNELSNGIGQYYCHWCGQRLDWE